MLATDLIQDLVDRTHRNINKVESLKQLSLDKVNWRADADTWSVLENIEHLNLYGDFYIPEIRKELAKSKSAANSHFKPGLLGDYFAKSMLPREKLNKMKTFKDKNPINSNLDKTCIDRFLDQQHQLLDLLSKAAKIDMNKVKVGTTIVSWLKIKLGDIFRVVIYHNDRHMVQIEQCLNRQ